MIVFAGMDSLQEGQVIAPMVPLQLGHLRASLTTICWQKGQGVRSMFSGTGGGGVGEGWDPPARKTFLQVAHLILVPETTSLNSIGMLHCGQMTFIRFPFEPYLRPFQLIGLNLGVKGWAGDS